MFVVMPLTYALLQAVGLLIVWQYLGWVMFFSIAVISGRAGNRAVERYRQEEERLARARQKALEIAATEERLGHAQTLVKHYVPLCDTESTPPSAP